MPARADAGGGRALALVIPAYRAAATVGDVVARARRAAPEARCYVVDDGSNDATQEAARAAGAVVLTHERNLGKGAALATGIAQALEDGADIIVTLDADGQHPPEEIPKLVDQIDQGADLVLGARDRSGPMPPSRRFTNWLSAKLTSRVATAPVPDAQTGFRAFTRQLALAVRPPESRYDYEVAFLLKAAIDRYRVVAVRIPTVYNRERSYFRSIADTWRVGRVFLRFRRWILAGSGGRQDA